MNAVPDHDPARRFLAAVQGIKARHVAAALASMLSGAALPLRSRRHWSGCSKGEMAREYAVVMHEPSGCTHPVYAAKLRQLDLTTLALRAKACAEGRAGWAHVGGDAGEACAPVLAPALATAELAGEVFKAPVLASLRQEVHDVSRCLLRTEDKLRAAEQRAKALQEHNAELVTLVAQAAVPGGIGEHEFSRPGGWLERALRVVAQALPAA
jgi:hypothetical protein